jgi:hypothetical protein
MWLRTSTGFLNLRNLVGVSFRIAADGTPVAAVETTLATLKYFDGRDAERLERILKRLTEPPPQVTRRPA